MVTNFGLTKTDTHLRSLSATMSQKSSLLQSKLCLRGAEPGHLPVGGIKEKIIAAHGAGIKRVMLPARNKKDFEDIPEEVRKGLEFIWLERVEDAVSFAFR